MCFFNSINNPPNPPNPPKSLRHRGFLLGGPWRVGRVGDGAASPSCRPSSPQRSQLMQLLLLSREPFAPLHRPRDSPGASQIRFQQLAGRVTPAAEQNAPASLCRLHHPCSIPNPLSL